MSERSKRSISTTILVLLPEKRGNLLKFRIIIIKFRIIIIIINESVSKVGGGGGGIPCTFLCVGVPLGR